MSVDSGQICSSGANGASFPTFVSDNFTKLASGIYHLNAITYDWAGSSNTTGFAGNNLTEFCANIKNGLKLCGMGG